MSPAMVDTSVFTALVSPSGLISLIALVIAAVAFAGCLKGTREASLRNPEAHAAYQVLEAKGRALRETRQG